MRVLHINKFGWAKGGSDVYMLRTCERLAALSGVEVALWAENPEVPAPVVGFDAHIPAFHEVAGLRNKAAAAANVVWSKQAARDLDEVVTTFRPDVAHLHLYAHQFSSSILRLLEERGVQTIATAHDYKLVCPAYLATRKGADCFKCSERLSLSLIKDTCLHDNRAWSSVAFVEAALVRRLKLVPKIVVAPSRYMYERLAESWLAPRADIRLIRNPAEKSGIEWVGGGGYLLYVGRLVAEKGLDQLIGAVKALDEPLRLVIAGDGPERGRLEALAGSDGAVEFTGHVGAERLGELRRHCLAQVIPSAWPENAPLAALEAAVDGVPLIATERGGLPELFELGARGALLRDSSPDGWTEAVRSVPTSTTPGDVQRLQQLRDTVHWDGHLAQLMTTYEDAIGRVDPQLEPAALSAEPAHA